MTTTCELCNLTAEMPAVYPAKQVVRCPCCGLVFYAGSVDPRQVYSDAYFLGAEYRDYLADERSMRRNFRRRLRDLRRLRPGGRLLEIGCAYGLFLDEARAHYEVRGLDIASTAVDYARTKLGLDAAAADFLDLPDEPQSCDVICLWDTLEHLPHPVRVIQKAAVWLKPGGVLALTTNDADSLVARWRKDKWRQMHPPSHLFFFSATTLRRALATTALEVTRIRRVGYYRGYRSMLHGLLASGGKRGAWLYRLLTVGGRIDLPIYLNLYDIVMLLARRPQEAAR